MLPFAQDESAQESSDHARMMQAHLRDTEAHLDQFAPQLLRSADGRRLIAWSALQPGQIDIEPYPHNTARLRLPLPLQDADLIDSSNAATIRRLELSKDDYGLQVPIDVSGGAHMIARANPAGFQRAHDLQVVWAGSRHQWLVLGGGIQWKEYNDLTGVQTLKRRVYSRTELDGRAGWIVLRATIQPGSFDSRQPHILGDNGYTLTPEGISLVTSPRNDAPRRSLTSERLNEDPDPPIYWSAIDWSAGRVMFPIAYVQPPQGALRRSPYIAQFARGSWNVSALDSVAIWSSTFPRCTFTTLPEES